LGGAVTTFPAPKHLYVALALPFVLASCWKEEDVVAIEADGNISVTATVAASQDPPHKSPKLEPRNKVYERLLSAYAEQLRTAGWDVEVNWIPDAALLPNGGLPEKVVFNMRGNVAGLKSAPEHYKLEAVEPNKRYSLRFVRPNVAPFGLGSRTVVFEKHWLKRNAEVLGPNGATVERIENADQDTPYTIVLK
jgi:hypothetical protein